MEIFCNHPHWNYSPWSCSVIRSDYKQSTRAGLGQPLPRKQLRQTQNTQDSEGKHSSQCLVNHSAKAYFSSDFLRRLLLFCGTFDERKMLTPMPWPHLHLSSSPIHPSYSLNEFLMLFFGVLPRVQCVCILKMAATVLHHRLQLSQATEDLSADNNFQSFH